MKKFWKWKTVLNKKPEETLETTAGVNEETTGEVQEGNPERILFLTGTIAQESWFDDEVTPEEFKNELESDEGDITVWINSPGGDCFAAARIYNMLKEYRGKVTVKIDGLAASAASVIAMAGDEVLMSPVSTLMIHNPSTIAAGDSAEMKKAQQMLEEAKETLINAYELKTGMSRRELAKLMDAETWMNANAALERHFIDGILYVEEAREPAPAAFLEFSPAQIAVAIAEKISAKCNIAKEPETLIEKAKVAEAAETPTIEAEVTQEPTGRKVDDLQARLDLIRRFI